MSSANEHTQQQPSLLQPPPPPPAAPRRVALTTVASGASASAGTSHRSGNNNNNTSSNSSATGSGRKTYRFELNLFEPTADSFPEFNYAKLVEMEEVRHDVSVWLHVCVCVCN